MLSILATTEVSTAAGMGSMLIWLVVLVAFMYFFMIRPQQKQQKKIREFQNALKYGYGEYEHEPTITSSIAMKTAQNTIVIGWLASQTDMLAEDWVFAE
mgnify:CR=1 FL=1